MITVVIPVFQGESILPVTISAVEELVADEVIWVDDGSTDQTPVLLADACSESGRLRVVTLLENRGRAAARNAGVDAAHGDVLVFFDADVEPPPGAALALADAALQSGAVASVARLRPVVSDPSEPYQDYVAHHPRGPAAGTGRDASLDWRFFLTGASAVRRDAFDAVGGFPEEVPYGEDVVFGCRLSALAPEGFRLAETTVRLHDVGDLSRAVENARRFGQAVAAFQEACLGGALRRLRAIPGLSRLAGGVEPLLRLAARHLMPGTVRRKAVRYLLASTALRAARRA